MEKLIKLLNEYAHTYADHYDDTGGEIECKFLYHTDQCFTYEEEGKYDTLVDDVVISKRYGFIKWLIENDKIDENNLNLKAFKSIFSGDGFVNISIYEVLLMLLATSDTPIEDLILYLK